MMVASSMRLPASRGADALDQRRVEFAPDRTDMSPVVSSTTAATSAIDRTLAPRILASTSSRVTRLLSSAASMNFPSRSNSSGVLPMTSRARDECCRALCQADLRGKQHGDGDERLNESGPARCGRAARQQRGDGQGHEEVEGGHLRERAQADEANQQNDPGEPDAGEDRAAHDGVGWMRGGRT